MLAIMVPECNTVSALADLNVAKNVLHRINVIK